MGLTEWLGTVAAGRAHVLVAAPRDAFRTRARLERAVVARGWALADAPADADVLAVCGRPEGETDEILAEALSSVWAGMPGPRMRVDVTDEAGIGPALERAAEALLDTRAHAADAESRDGDMDHGDMDHGDTDHGDMDHGEHGDMAPAGIPLAAGGPDRDGLEMDVLHVALGPVLPSWPAGLVLDVALQGDVVVAAAARYVGGRPGEADRHAQEPAERAARRVDGVARLLDLAGWADGASRARRVRDLLLDGDRAAGHRLLVGLRTRVGRSRLLRWQLRDLGRPGQPDVHDRLVTALGNAVDDLDGAAAGDRGGADPDGLASATVGLELAAVRLVVAAADLDPLPSRREVVGG